MKKLWSTVLLLLFASLTQAQSASQSQGTLQVNGQAGKYQIFQKVKAVRCTVGQRGACDAPVYFDLNKAQVVAPGAYLVGFENSIYPDLVNVDAGQAVTLNLGTISIPSQIHGNKIRVYRDFSSPVEQKKILLTMFTMNRHFFRLDQENFDDLYLAGSWERDFVQRFTYEICPKIQSFGDVSPAALALCKTWNTATDASALSDFYKFSDDGTFQEMWVTSPGDVIPSTHPRYLVSAPIGEQDVVAVFPGVYKIQGEGKNSLVVSISVGQ
ncbi:MAG: hypothetical protein ACXVCY_09445 [Pseudobdellovibrionaceae bacterium]